MIKITSLNKIYKSKRKQNCHALKDINLTLPDTGLVFVLGKSGSGKSTFLNLIGGLDSFTSGSIEVDGNNLSKFNELDFCNYRNTHIGFIFQDYHLIDELTVYENIALSLNLRRVEDDNKVKAALTKVDLEGYENRYPSELSGGEQQRVAIARALVKNPRIILADEPTGNLDTNTSQSIIKLIKDLSTNCLVIIVSHNILDANKYADRIIELSKGTIISDKSKNPEFPDEMILQNNTLFYPVEHCLSDKDIDLINNNNNSKIIKQTDKFLDTSIKENPSKFVKIENNSLSLNERFKLSGNFLKHELFALIASSFMIAVLVIIMALAQTIINFDSNKIISDEMNKSKLESIIMNKVLDEETKDKISTNHPVTIDENDIQTFYDMGYTGKIYPVLNYTIFFNEINKTWGFTNNNFQKVYLSESLGTLIVDEGFLARKFGDYKYAARIDEFKDYGIIIPDYIADAIILLNRKYYGVDYEDLLEEYIHTTYSTPICYINAIIDTGYKDKYKELIERVNRNPFITKKELYSDPDFESFLNEIYSSLGYCYTTNPNFYEDYFNSKLAKFSAHYTLVFNNTMEFQTNKSPYVIKSDLPSQTVNMNIKKYNEIFGTEYDLDNYKDFVPHKATLTHYDYNDVDKENPLFSIEVTISSLFYSPTGRTMDVSHDIYDLFSKDWLRPYALYFDGTSDIGHILDETANLNYDHLCYSIETIHHMAKAVVVFIPMFEFISIFLYTGIIFILISFSSRVINNKMDNIGILKALGTKNSTITIVFGLQVAFIALLTCILSTIGYFIFIDFANIILLDSLRHITPGKIIIDLDFLVFTPSIAFENCILICCFSIISMIIPLIKIKAIKPAKIIKTKE